MSSSFQKSSTNREHEVFLFKVEKSNAPNVCNVQIKITKEIFALAFDLYYSRSYKFSHN